MSRVPRPTVLGFGTYDADRHPRVRVLLEGLAEHGFPVRECTVPLGLGTAQRVRVLHAPWRLPGLAARLAVAWGRLVVRVLRIPARHRRVVLVGYLGHFDVLLARVLFPRARIVLDHLVFAADTALDRGVPGGWKVRALGLLDRVAIRCADVVVVDTEEHAALVPAARRDRTVVVPVGADASWARARADRDGADVAGTAEDAAAGVPEALGSGAGPLSVVFYGLMTPLQGAPVVAGALRRLAGSVRATVVGRGQDSVVVDALLSGTPNLRRVDWVVPAELPSLVADHDVCLGVFGTSRKAARVVPNKVFQGLAAGCVIVTSDTAPQRRLLGDAAVLVPPGDEDALAAALISLAGDRARVAELHRRSETVRSAITPSAVTIPLVEILADEAAGP